jgi:plasmid stabilization system protein ParE
VKYRFSVEARADVREAKAFLLKESKKKRDDFASALEHAIHAVLDHPYRGSPYELGTRRILLEGCYYAMIYIPAGDVIQIVAVSHHRRDPEHWHGRISGSPTGPRP